MFEQDLLHEDFTELLQQRLRSVEELTGILTRVSDPDLRQRLGQLQSHAARQVELAERLVEIVS